MDKLFSFVFFVVLLSSCNKNKNKNPDTAQPVIILTSPTNGQVFAAGQTIPITGTITDNEYIAEVHIHAYNNTTNALLMDVHIYPAGNSTTFSQQLVAAAGTTYRIQVNALDKEINEGKASVIVSSN